MILELFFRVQKPWSLQTNNPGVLMDFLMT